MAVAFSFSTTMATPLFHQACPFPQELIDIIIDHLCGDHRSLRRCLRVSKAFFPAARAGLWRHLCLDRVRESKKGKELIPSALLQSLVRTVLITLYWDTWLALPHMNGVAHLELDIIRGPQLVADAVLASAQIRSWPLVSLSIRGLFLDHNECCAKWCAFFACFPNLKHVKFAALSCHDLLSEAPFCTGQRHDRLPHLQTLYIHDGYDWDWKDGASPLFGGHLFSLKSLRTLAVSSLSKKTAALLQLPACLDELILVNGKPGKSLVCISFFDLTFLSSFSLFVEHVWDTEGGAISN